MRGVASAAAGALLRSLSSAAGSLARNLDLLAGDDDHARRAAAARYLLYNTLRNAYYFYLITFRSSIKRTTYNITF